MTFPTSNDPREADAIGRYYHALQRLGRSRSWSSVARRLVVLEHATIAVEETFSASAVVAAAEAATVAETNPVLAAAAESCAQSAHTVVVEARATTTALRATYNDRKRRRRMNDTGK